MNSLLRSYVYVDGAILKKKFDAQTREPALTQKNFLLRILRRNQETEYGKKYGFSSIRDEKEYQRRVPQVCGVSRFFNLTTHRFLDSPLTSHRFSRD